MSKRITITMPEGIEPDALLCVFQSATANAPAAATAAERSAFRNGFDHLKTPQCRAAVEFLRILVANELARLAGAPSSVIGGGSSVLIERGE